MVKQKRFLLGVPICLFFVLLFGTYSLATSNQVFDQADLFSNVEEQEINEEAKRLSGSLEIDLMVVTTNDSQGKSSRQFAIDFYDDYELGYGNTGAGVLYLVNMEKREIFILTSEEVNHVLTDGRIDEILDSVFPYVVEGQYSESAHVFLKEVEANMLSTTHNDDEIIVGEHSTSGEGGLGLVQELGIYFLISIVIGGISVGIMSLSNKGRSTVNETTYLEKNSFIVTKRTDRHYNTRITQQRIPKNNSRGVNSNSGGGFGGGGRKF